MRVAWLLVAALGLVAPALARCTTDATSAAPCARRRGTTGYAHESWHFRYVGQPLARHVRRERIVTLEEAFGLVGAPS